MFSALLSFLASLAIGLLLSPVAGLALACSAAAYAWLPETDDEEF